jgi:hypothetical protein
MRFVVFFALALQACSSSEATPSTPRPQAAPDASDCARVTPPNDGGGPNETTLTPNDRVTANVYMRHVLDGRLLAGGDPEEVARSYEILEALLEGPTGPKIDAEVVALSCTQSLATSTCTVTIVLPTDEVAYALEIDVTKGKLSNPKMYLFAG